MGLCPFGIGVKLAHSLPASLCMGLCPFGIGVKLLNTITRTFTSSLYKFRISVELLHCIYRNQTSSSPLTPISQITEWPQFNVAATIFSNQFCFQSESIRLNIKIAGNFNDWFQVGF